MSITAPQDARTTSKRYTPLLYTFHIILRIQNRDLVPSGSFVVTYSVARSASSGVLGDSWCIEVVVHFSPWNTDMALGASEKKVFFFRSRHSF